MATKQTGSTQPTIPTTRQLHEAERIQDRFGRVLWTTRGTALRVHVYGDDPEARLPHRILTLATDGRIVAAEQPPMYVPPATTEDT